MCVCVCVCVVVVVWGVGRYVGWVCVKEGVLARVRGATQGGRGQ